MNLGNIAGVLVIGIVMFLVVKKIFKSGSCCSNRNSRGGQRQTGNYSRAENDDQKRISPIGETVRDPICGMHINKDSAIAKEFNGVIIYFCCESCVNKFEAKNRTTS